jgi:hypothetical protein
MSDYTFLVPGFIPTDCISSPGELDQMVADAQPVSNVSFNYYSATAPDIITYPALARCIWVDTHATPYVKRLYDTGTSSWIIEVPAPGSITGDMIADSTIPLTKLKASLYGANTVAQVNGTSTAWQAVPANTLFSSSYRLDINSLSLSAVGAYVLSSNGVTNSWATFASYFTAGVVPISSISTSGAPDPSVLSFVGGTLGYRTVNASVADDTLAITKLVSGPANTILGMDSSGAVKTWLTPAQMYSLFQPFIGATLYATAPGLVQAVPAAGASVTFATGQGAAVTNFGAWLICVTAENGYVTGDRVLWTSCYDNNGTEEINFMVAMGANGDLIVQRPGIGGHFIGSNKSGSVYNAAFTPANWRVGGWAYAV